VDRRRDRAAVAAAYAATHADLTRALADGDRRDARLAATRLGLMGLALGLGIGSYVLGRGSVGLAVVPLAGFGVVAVVHALHLARHARVRRRALYVEDGIARLEDRWHGRGVVSVPDALDSHPYADDLDLFGRGSLFDLLCTARTDTGRQALRSWLLTPAPPADIHARQQAIRELADRPAFREDLAVLGPELSSAAATAHVAAWARARPTPPAAWVPPVLVLLSAATLLGLQQWWQTGMPPDWLGGAIAAQAVVGFGLRGHVRRVIQDVESRVRDLAVAGEILARIERESFTSALLTGTQARLSASGAPATVEIRRLTRLVELLTSRQNQILGPLSVLVFWATHLAWAIDRWRARVGRHAGEWFEVVGQFEALAALATFAAERPDAVFPEIEPGPPRLDADAVVHPLLPPAAAVGNDVCLGAPGPQLLMVSGSNMSGKSTYLRALGVTVVLAQAGAPVCAGRLRMTPLTPAGTMRVQDSLEAGRSRFFAEITKLRRIVDLARTRDGPGTLFLVDELLAGTNSHDRRLGAAGVLRGLVDLGAIGVATTHDLALTALVDGFGARAANAHFADRFEDGHLAFDYRLRPGVVTGSNALALMRSVGLDV
jgi:hypothetical protein